ncbi:MAG: L-glyceraldehyde 3-phosphate reductase [Chitinophagaceae bacterium]|nr:MAG: L-glyceraldehyde 3-phosphate reductase [Chitinophagaceae bacterium]
MFTASPDRYKTMRYNRSGKSGLLLPAVALGLWQNFGSGSDQSLMREMILGSFDLGITHFDLANNYGPPGGAAETNFGQVLKSDLSAYRDELIIATKAGYYMWPGPYGEWGSKKYLVASIDQSLKRMGLEYVDIFYSHRPDPNTPLEETMGALDSIVRSGKALYAGISNYSAADTQAASNILRSLGTPCVVHQPRYSLLDRWVEEKTTEAGHSLLEVLQKEGIGSVVFSPLAQGRLSDKYLDGIPSGSRIAKNFGNGAINETAIDDHLLSRLRQLNNIARERNQTLAQMAIAWLLKDENITSVLIGASSLSQVQNCVDALQQTSFTEGELSDIEKILANNFN